MNFQLVDDFRYQFRGGGEFSSKESGFIFVQSEKPWRKSMKEPPLELYMHTRFIQSVLCSEAKECMWLVEQPSDEATTSLKKIFHKYMSEKLSMCGYLNCDASELQLFWDLCGSLIRTALWTMEQPWAVVGLRDQLPKPTSGGWSFVKAWTIEHVLRNHSNVTAIFVQEGWFAYFGFRPSKRALELLTAEFPGLSNMRATDS